MKATVYLCLLRVKGKVYVEMTEPDRDAAREFCRMTRRLRPGVKRGDVWYVGVKVNVPTKRPRRKAAA